MRKQPLEKPRCDLMIGAVLAFLISLMDPLAWAEGLTQNPRTARQLADLSLEELMNIEVTSVAKKEQKLSEAAAAVYVLTQEDIHRSGATSIAEALRMAPGLQVARIDANKWAISSRGFNGRFSNKLLVLIDGRSVYSPLFSGVYWDVQDTMLEEIDRIEVIRGPAGTLWGANAVNGVINIITKNARETQGGLITGGAGNEEQAFGGFRYGGKLGGRTYARVYGKYLNRDDFSGVTGIDSHDEWKIGRGGFRLDSKNVSRNDSLTLQGDYYHGSFGDFAELPSLADPFVSRVVDNFPVAGGNILGRWTRRLSSRSELALQLYYDRTERKDAVHREIRDSFDLEAQNRIGLARGQDLVWGLGYRFSADRIPGDSVASFRPKKRDSHLFSAFVQDDVMLVEKRLRLTLGSKFEHNDFSGFEVQPNVRLLWVPQDHHTLWTAISRAVRTPARFEHDIQVRTGTFEPFTASCPALFPCEVQTLGDKDFESEDLVAYELGYRAQLSSSFSLDIATFYNLYNDLRTAELGTPFPTASPPPLRLVIPVHFDNKMDGESYGIEIAPNWRVTDHWKLSMGYTFLKSHLRRSDSSTDTTSKAAAGDSPQNQLHVRSYLDLPHNLKLDTALYYVDSLPNQKVPSYVRVDARLGWNPVDRLDVSISLQNLSDRRHREFGESFLVTPTKIERSLYGKITWKF